MVLPQDLAHELEQCKRQERRTLSTIVRDALDLYLRDHRRRSAGNALKRAALTSPLDEAGVRRALAELEDERGRSDRI